MLKWWCLLKPLEIQGVVSCQMKLCENMFLFKRYFSTELKFIVLFNPCYIHMNLYTNSHKNGITCIWMPKPKQRRTCIHTEIYFIPVLPSHLRKSHSGSKEMFHFGSYGDSQLGMLQICRSNAIIQQVCMHISLWESQKIVFRHMHVLLLV